MLDLKELELMTLHAIFAEGHATDTILDLPNPKGKMFHWIAIRGGGPKDWAIYAAPDFWTDERVHGLGEKIRTESVIRKLVPCTDDAFKAYRW